MKRDDLIYKKKRSSRSFLHFDAHVAEMKRQEERKERGRGGGMTTTTKHHNSCGIDLHCHSELTHCISSFHTLIFFCTFSI